MSIAELTQQIHETILERLDSDNDGNYIGGFKVNSALFRKKFGEKPKPRDYSLEYGLMRDEQIPAIPRGVEVCQVGFSEFVINFRFFRGKKREMYFAGYFPDGEGGAPRIVWETEPPEQALQWVYDRLTGDLILPSP